jgi:hypothetical protein
MIMRRARYSALTWRRMHIRYISGQDRRKYITMEIRA